MYLSIIRAAYGVQAPVLVSPLEQHAVRLLEVVRLGQLEPRIFLLEVHRGLDEEQARGLAVVPHAARVHGHLAEALDDVPLRDDLVVARVQVFRLDLRRRRRQAGRGPDARLLGGGGGNRIGGFGYGGTRGLTVPIGQPSVLVERASEFFGEVGIRTELIGTSLRRLHGQVRGPGQTHLIEEFLHLL